MDSSDTGSIPNRQAQERIPFWRDERVLRVVAQIISAIVVIGALYWSVTNILTAADQRGLGLGYGFLSDAAGFSISESIIPYNPSNTFARALLIGILNTIRISIIGVFFATILGFVVGVALLSTNWLVSKLALAFVEVHRNIPLLVLLFLWYRGIFTQLPAIKDSLTWPGPVFINQRGIYMIWPGMTSSSWIFIGFALAGLVSAIAAWILLKKRQEYTGNPTYFAYAAPAVVLVMVAVGWLLSGGRPFTASVPSLQGFNFEGGLRLTPEFTALLIGLSTYTASFIAEIVRAGIQAVSRGQIEAAKALGLKELTTLNLVVLPQAMRIIIPPLISQYLNLTKNSSLAVFLGFPELFSIGKTVINQAGKAVPVFAFIMAAYLVISLFTSLVLNVYNRRVQFLEK